jgi:hypothetical protein
MRSPRSRPQAKPPEAPPEQAAVRIAVIVCPSADNPSDGPALAALSAQTLGLSAFEVLVSPVGPAHRAAQAKCGPDPSWANLHWLDGPAHTIGEAREKAAAHTTAPLLALLDPLAQPAEDWLARLCAAFESDPAPALVTGRVRPRWGSPRPIWFPDSLLETLGLIDHGEHARWLEPNEAVSCVNLAVRRDAVAGSGGFGRLPDDAMIPARGLIGKGGEAFFEPAASVTLGIPASHVTQGWFRRQAAWRATRDAARSPAPESDAVAARWDAVKQYLYACPPGERTLRALVLEQSDADRFAQQVTAVYDSVSCLLAGAGEPYFD